MFGSKPQLKIGTAAPPFTLTAHDGTAIKLAGFRGAKRVVLAFYPQDDTPG